jgi:hypothetical protein
MGDRRVVDTALVDAAFDAFVDWRAEASEVQRTFDRWVEAPPEERVAAYALHHVALLREEVACELYATALALGRQESARERAPDRFRLVPRGRRGR